MWQSIIGRAKASIDTKTKKSVQLEKPIKCQVDDADELTIVQAQNLANLPFTFKHVALKETFRDSK